MTPPPPLMICGCDPLCDACLHQRVAWHKGTAQARGEAWARAIARVVPIDRPWPITEKMRAMARRKVNDIAKDERLSEALIDEVVVGASRWWNRELALAG